MAEPGPSHPRWLDRLLPVGVLLASLALSLLASRVTAPAFDELGRLAAVDSVVELVKGVAREGPKELATPAARLMLEGKSALLVLLGAWAKLSLGRMGVLDPLTAMRLPWLVLGALAPLAVYVALRPSQGRVTALVGALLLLLVPRWVHGVVVLREGALLGATWALIGACYLRSLGPAAAVGERPRRERRTLAWATLGALGLGLGCSLSLATLWVLLPISAHFVLLRPRRTRRLLRQGRLPLPVLVLLALPLGPLSLLAVTPQLWQASPALVARFLLAPLAPRIEPADFAGAIVERWPVPAGYAASWLVSTSPLVITLAGALGVVALAHHVLARRFASGSLRPPADRHGAGLLATLVVVGALLGPALSPRVLSVFPPRTELALPFVAMLAAIGLGWAARLPRRAGWGRGLVVGVLVSLALALPGLSTAGSAFAPLLGGAQRIAATRALPIGDGSEIGPLLSAIDQHAGGAISAPREVPPDLWRVLRESGRMKSNVVPGAGGLELARGTVPGADAVSRVRRDGAVLWSLVRR